MAKESTIRTGAALLRANWPLLAVPDDTDELWVKAFEYLDDRDFEAAIESWIEHQPLPFWPSVNEVKGLAARARRLRETVESCGECRDGLCYGDREDGSRYMYPCPCPAGEDKRRWLKGEKDEEPTIVSIPSTAIPGER